MGWGRGGGRLWYGGGGGRGAFAVAFALFEDGADVIAGAAEVHGGEEGLAVGGGGAAVPSEHVDAAGVVIGEGVGFGEVGGGVAAEQFGEVPGAGAAVEGGIEEGLVLEGGDFFGLGPFLGGEAADLHEAQFAGGAGGIVAEAALAPGHGFDEGRVDFVMGGGGEQVGFGGFFAAVEPPPAGDPDIEGQPEREQGDDPGFHGGWTGGFRGGRARFGSASGGWEAKCPSEKWKGAR